MRVAYLDCFAGAAGDMFLGALVDAGVPEQVLHDAVHALNLNASLRIERVDRSGITCTKVHVLEGGELAEKQALSHSHVDPRVHGHSHRHPQDSEPLEQAPLKQEPLSEQEKTQHLHKGGHGHKHDHEHDHGHSHEHKHSHEEHVHSHAHGRSLTTIRKLISDAPLHDAVKTTAIRAFELLGHSEAKIHGVPVDEIHFHEVGAVDAIVDIVASAAGIHHLKIGSWYSSPLNVGGGMVECAHGTFPVPAPATADLLRGVPTYSAHVQKELVTPTGAALIRALEPTFGAQPGMVVEHIGYGAGTRNPKDFPNVLRLSVGTLQAPTAPGNADQVNASAGGQTDTVTVIETALDDATPQLLAYVTEQALAQGALDAMLTPVLMKKGRPGTLLTLLCAPDRAEALQQLVLRETPTLGIRVRQDQRILLGREHVSVETTFGSVRVKLGTENGSVRNVAPEYEDCKTLALRNNVSLKDVQQAAVAAYLQGKN